MRVVVEGLAHRFPGTDLLFEHLDFVAEPGSTIAVCGPSGCGKSTLLSILAGWEKPYAGTVTREGVNRVGWVFQNPYGVAERTALDHVVFPLLAKGMRRKEAELKALEAMGLFDLEYAACGWKRIATSPAARRNVSCWHAPSAPNPTCCSWTSRPPNWTRAPRIPSAMC